MDVIKARRGARWISRGMMLGALLSVQVAHADPSPEDKAGARSAAERGGVEFKAGHFKEALDLFRRAESLIHAPTHLLMIARTHAALGDIVVAKESYLKITREDLASKAPAAFKRAQEDAEKELKELEPKIPSIQVTVTGAIAPTKLVVLMDDKPVPPALVGIPRPVNPGKHAFTATATGFAAPERSLTVKEGEVQSLVLELKPIAIAGSGSAGQDGAGAAEGVAPPPKTSGARYVGLAMIGVGVAGVVVGGAFGGLYATKRGEANTAYDKCSPGCAGAAEATVRALDTDANGKGTISVIGIAAGGTLAIAGTVLFLVNKPKAAAAARVVPWIGYGSAGVAGSF